MTTYPPPTTATDETYPIWTDLVHNWRAVDASWLRDRSVQVFDDGNERNTVLGSAARQGMTVYLKATGTTDPLVEPAGLYVRHATTWESVRYPNLTVSSDPTSVTMVRSGSGSGITLRSDGSTGITNLFAGASPLGAAINASGISLRVGTKTVVLSTNATQLTVDSPVLVTGDVTSTATLRGVAAALTGNLTAVNATLSGTLTVPSATMSGTMSAGLLQSTDAEMTTASSLAVYRNRLSPTNRLSFSSTGAAVLTGSTVVVNGATTLASPVVAQGTVEIQGIATLRTAGTTAAPVAGVIALSRAPTSGDVYPNGTIWFQV